MTHVFFHLRLMLFDATLSHLFALLDCLTVNFGLLLKGQSHSPDGNYCILSVSTPRITRRGVIGSLDIFSFVLSWLSLLHNFIQQSLNLGAAHVQILPSACRRLALVRASDNALSWKYGLTPFVGQPLYKANSSFLNVFLKLLWY